MLTHPSSQHTPERPCRVAALFNIANANYATPNPSVAVITAAIAELQQNVMTLTNVKRQLTEITTIKDQSRAVLETLFKTRGTYVQLTSNGNTALNLNAGFAVRAAPSPVGQLPPPINLLIELNGTAGLMLLSWELCTMQDLI